MLRISSPRQAKSADNIDGAIFICDMMRPKKDDSLNKVKDSPYQYHCFSMQIFTVLSLVKMR